jgi:hypothetical protein
MASKSIAEAMAQYEAEHEFIRLVTLPVEDRAKYMPTAKWEGGYRWFRAPNVVSNNPTKRVSICSARKVKSAAMAASHG